MDDTRVTRAARKGKEEKLRELEDRYRNEFMDEGERLELRDLIRRLKSRAS